MRYLVLLSIIISSNALGYATGEGSVDLGISQEDEKKNIGLATNYQLTHSNSWMTTYLHNKTQLGSDRGRSLVATAAHEYQYEQSFIQSEISNLFNFYYPGLTWQNNLSQNIEFDQLEVDNLDNEDDTGSTDFSERNINWTLSSGPSFVYERSQWVNVNTSVIFSKANSFDEKSSEQNINIRISKPLTSFTKSEFDFNRICTQYNNSTLNNSCREEITLSFSSEKKFSKFKVNIGLSSQDDVETDLYLVNIDHRINSYSSIQIESQKIIEKISDIDQLEGFESIAFESAVKRTDSMSYVYEWGRKRFEFRVRQQETIGKDYSFYTKDGAAYYAYQLGSNLCKSCKIGLSYEYLKYDERAEQKIKTIALTKNHSSKISSSIGFRRTQIGQDLDAWSINLLLSFKGSITKLGKR